MTPLPPLSLSHCLPLLEAKSRTHREVSPHNCLEKAAIWFSYSCLFTCNKRQKCQIWTKVVEEHDPGIIKPGQVSGV